MDDIALRDQLTKIYGPTGILEKIELYIPKKILDEKFATNGQLHVALREIAIRYNVTASSYSHYNNCIKATFIKEDI